MLVDKDGGSLLAPDITFSPEVVFIFVTVPIADIVDEDDIGFELVPPPLLVPIIRIYILFYDEIRLKAYYFFFFFVASTEQGYLVI